MPDVSVLLWDVGGVLLSNAWDHTARTAAADHFQINPAEFERRHERVVGEFETGRLDLDGYMASTVFHARRNFSPAMFRQFMFDRSTPRPGALAFAKQLHRRGGRRMVALNNESRELNEFRITTFRLKDVFDVFLSSCYTGLRKPDPAAFRYALTLTQCDPDRTVFLDDRPENVEAAARLGLRTILVRRPEDLAAELARNGVAAR